MSPGVCGGECAGSVVGTVRSGVSEVQLFGVTVLCVW